ncbi:MAG: TIGR03915 family putative DNA repair protein [Bacillota bacterium]|nr:TIGR03915 family putative DNA repair protein [Bacillota bacterium]
MFVLHEPTFDGLLSAVAWCLRQREERPVLLPGFSEPLLFPASNIPVEAGIRRLFRRHFMERLGQAAAADVLKKVFSAFLSEEDGIGTRIYRFLYQALRQRCDPSGQLQDPDIAAVVQAAARVGGQAHQYLGLLRFRLLQDQFYLAEFEPDYHVLPLILSHFIDRLQDQQFVICDRKRSIAAWYKPGKGCTLHILEDDGKADLRTLSLSSVDVMPEGNDMSAQKADHIVTDHDFEQLWQRYLKHLTIPERRNLKLQQANMPKKYWKYLVEQPFNNP